VVRPSPLTTAARAAWACRARRTHEATACDEWCHLQASRQPGY
jgi:hypothetical protein